MTILAENKMETPEKIYIHPGVHNYNSEIPFTGSIEYIRSDIAKSETIEAIIAFANWYDGQQNSPEMQNEKWMNETNAKSFLKEFLNSRKK